MNMEMRICGDFGQQAGCIIVLSSTHKAWNFGSVTSTVIVLPRERVRDLQTVDVCGGHGLITSQCYRGRLKRIVMLCPWVCLCARLCAQYVHAFVLATCVSFHLYVCISGSLCICVSLHLYALLPPYVFAYVHAACLCMRSCTSKG